MTTPIAAIIAIPMGIARIRINPTTMSKNIGCFTIGAPYLLEGNDSSLLRFSVPIWVASAVRARSM